MGATYLSYIGNSFLLKAAAFVPGFSNTYVKLLKLPQLSCPSWLPFDNVTIDISISKRRCEFLGTSSITPVTLYKSYTVFKVFPTAGVFFPKYFSASVFEMTILLGSVQCMSGIAFNKFVSKYVEDGTISIINLCFIKIVSPFLNNVLSLPINLTDSSTSGKSFFNVGAKGHLCYCPVGIFVTFLYIGD